MADRHNESAINLAILALNHTVGESDDVLLSVWLEPDVNVLLRLWRRESVVDYGTRRVTGHT